MFNHANVVESIRGGETWVDSYDRRIKIMWVETLTKHERNKKESKLELLKCNVILILFLVGWTSIIMNLFHVVK